MIRRWVFEGGLEDAACEFFIIEAAAAVVAPRGGGGSEGSGSGARDLWRDTHRLELAKLPPFISQDLALTILRAGKSINFLRDACGDKGWVQEWAPAAAGAAAELGYGQVRKRRAGLAWGSKGIWPAGVLGHPATVLRGLTTRAPSPPGRCRRLLLLPQLPVLERVVVSASASVDARLMAVLRSTGEWDKHCQAIRRYLLLGQVRHRPQTACGCRG
jgi:hypothetical protein